MDSTSPGAGPDPRKEPQCSMSQTRFRRASTTGLPISLSRLPCIAAILGRDGGGEFPIESPPRPHEAIDSLLCRVRSPPPRVQRPRCRTKPGSVSAMPVPTVLSRSRRSPTVHRRACDGATRPAPSLYLRLATGSYPISARGPPRGAHRSMNRKNAPRARERVFPIFLAGFLCSLMLCRLVLSGESRLEQSLYLRLATGFSFRPMGPDPLPQAHRSTNRKEIWRDLEKTSRPACREWFSRRPVRGRSRGAEAPRRERENSRASIGLSSTVADPFLRDRNSRAAYGEPRFVAIYEPRVSAFGARLFSIATQTLAILYTWNEKRQVAPRAISITCCAGAIEAGVPAEVAPI